VAPAALARCRPNTDGNHTQQIPDKYVWLAMASANNGRSGACRATAEIARNLL
jgi:hypothetical protein